MNYDWNWFFSSLSQSSAALIGIIAAFVISRLIGLNEKINNTISHFDSLVINYNRIVEILKKRRFYWYNYTLVELNYDLKTAILEKEFDNLSEIEIVSKIYEMISDLFEYDEPILKAYYDICEECEHPKVLNIDATKQKLDDIAKEKDKISQSEIEAKTSILQFSHKLKELEAFLDSIKPLKPLIIILMIIFPIIVVYPLQFMPININQSPVITFNLYEIINSIITIKGILLFLFTISIEGVFYYFLSLNVSIKSKTLNAMTNCSTDYMNIKKYSPYLNEE